MKENIKAYSWIEGKRVISDDLKKRKLATRLKKLGYVDIDREMIRFLEGQDANKNIFITSSEKDQGKINGLIAYLWCKFGIDSSMKVMNSYELVEIFLGNLEGQTSLLNLDSQILVILHGYNEMANKRLPDFILQVLDNRRRLHLVTWFINRGSRCNLDPVQDYITSNSFDKIAIRDSSKGKGRLGL